jgi:hypothetical protein
MIKAKKIIAAATSNPTAIFFLRATKRGAAGLRG